MIIDFSTHIFPRQIMGFLKETGHPKIETVISDARPSLVSPEERLKIMDKHKIDMQVLTLSQAVYRIAKVDEDIELCRRINDIFFRTI